VPVWFYFFWIDLPGSLRHAGGSHPVPERSTSQAVTSRILEFTRTQQNEGDDYYRRACRKRWEASSAKNGHSVFTCPSERALAQISNASKKGVRQRRYTDPRGSRSGFGAIAVGYYRRGKARVYCRQGRDRVRQDLLRRLGEARTAGDGGFFFGRGRAAATRGPVHG